MLRWASAAQAQAAPEGMAGVPAAARWTGHISEVREMVHGTVVG